MRKFQLIHSVILISLLVNLIAKIFFREYLRMGHVNSFLLYYEIIDWVILIFVSFYWLFCSYYYKNRFWKKNDQIYLKLIIRKMKEVNDARDKNLSCCINWLIFYEILLIMFGLKDVSFLISFCLIYLLMSTIRRTIIYIDFNSLFDSIEVNRIR